MKKSVTLLIFLASFLVLARMVLGTNFVKAENNVCCEKLTTGQWCQSAPAASCDTSYSIAPTSCESTDFCSVGTCVDSQEGICEKEVAKNVCNNDGGVWFDKSPSELPQCQLGCCTLGDGASFVTQSRCKKLSSYYGVQTDFNPGISSEIECIASAGGDEKGACTFERGAERTCRVLTKSKCNTLKGNSENSNVEFFEGLLCSDENLGTNCGPSKKTRIVDGQSEVYFIDSCGNLANIYDAKRIKDKSYWSKIIPKEESCGFGQSNANSKICGNCDYYRGSTAAPYKRGETAKPTYGDYICKDLSCEYKGQKYQHGESWCGEAPGIPRITDPNKDGNYLFNGKDSLQNPEKTNLPGSVYTKLTCYNGEVTVDNCYDGRQKVCVQSEVNGFKNAACKLNSWQECYSQKSKPDCLDRTKRECIWTQGKYTEELGLQKSSYTQKGYCTPLLPPGFDFWKGEGNGDSICSLGTIACEYKIKKKLISGKSVADGEECINEDGSIKKQWIDAMNKRCIQIGDCGAKTNYLGKPGESKVIVEKKIAKGGGVVIMSDGIKRTIY